MVNFKIYDITEGLELAFPPHFMNCSLRKILLMLYSVYWSDFIVYLPLLLEILDNMCIVISCCSVCDVITFEINHSFPIKSFFYITNK